MFWRFGFTSASAIDGLLDKEGVTLEELFEEEELLQECKAHNAKLIEFLCKPEILSQLLAYITTEDLDEAKRFKYPYLASEVLCCEIFTVCEAVISNNELLNTFWSFLDRPAPLNPLHASYFSKVNGVLLQKKTPEMITFVRAQENIVNKLLAHIGTSAIADLLLKLISMEELAEGAGIVSWLAGEGLIPSLLSRLDPSQDPDIHNTASQTLLDIIAVSYQNIGPPEQVVPGGINDQTNANFASNVGGNTLVDELKSEVMMNKLVGYMLDKTAPNTGSTLTNGINIIIELIRRYCSEIEQAEFQQHQHQLQQQQSRQGPPPPSEEKLQSLATDLNDLLRVLGSRLLEFADLLTAPRNITPVDTTIGKQTPLGSERLKTCELFAEILHLQYLYTSSPLFERLLVTPEAKKPSAGAGPSPMEGVEAEGSATSATSALSTASVADELIAVTDKFIDAKVLPVCLDLFFNFPWNNFLHSVVYDMIAKVFNTYSFTSTANVGKPPETPTGGAEGAEAKTTALEEQMKGVKNSVRKLVLSIFKDGNLTKRITNAQRQNDTEVASPKGVRLGYMGHLTYISDEVCKLLEKCGADFNTELKEFISAEEWQDYVNGPLRETKERDRQPLGGARPNTGQQGHGLPLVTGVGGFSGNLDEADTGASVGGGAVGGGGVSPKKEARGAGGDSDEEEDEIEGLGTGEVYATDGDVSGDQFARYLCQQIVNDLPDRFLGGESSDEEDGDWGGEFDPKDIEFDMREAFTSDNPFPDKRSSLGDDFEDDDTRKGSSENSSVSGSSSAQPPSVGSAIASTSTTPAPAPTAFSTKAPPATVDAFDAKELLDALNSTQTGGNESAPSSTPANQGWADFGSLNASGGSNGADGTGGSS
ncbi:hypothetical protein HK097_008201 [Rhizophlyctis rosea]|uniref:SAPS-domain-containing protein n=1 Tax=Rhizophlyctis rosea TaxID=64517 RepID=A0AAD5SJ56_9FUNG|nr:hypothetical protein HK097_008201 [Rhizophlyctis rosea]